MKLDLSQFYGTENYYRWSKLFPNVLLTDGAYYVAQEAEAYWLMEAIASHLVSIPANESFVIAELKLKGNDSAELLLMADKENGIPIGLFAKQKISFTDFPEDISFYCIRRMKDWILLLPSEY